MESFPPEVILSYALSLDLPSITNLCQTNYRFNELVCDNEYFWKQMFIRDYHYNPEFSGSWKHLYQVFGNVWSFGSNIYGQLGLSDDVARDRPTQIPDIKAKAVSCSSHSMIIDMEDNVWSFGDNYSGQLGLGDTLDRNTPTQIPNIKAKAISCSYSHSMIIDLENNVWSFGNNADGQLGLGDNQDRRIPTQIPNFKANGLSCGANHNLLIGFKY